MVNIQTFKDLVWKKSNKLLSLTNSFYFVPICVTLRGLRSGSHFQKVSYLDWCFPLKFKLRRFFCFDCVESDSKFVCVCSFKRSWGVVSFFKFMSEYGQPKALVCIKMKALLSVSSDKSGVYYHWNILTSHA